MKLPKIKLGDSTLEKIHASFIDSSITLNETQEEIKERLLIVWTLRTRHPSTKVAFNIYHRKTKKNRTQFFRDTKAANSIFGNLYASNKKANKIIYEEMLKRWLEKCEKEGDNDNAVKLLKLLGDTWQVASIEETKINPEKLTNPQIKLKISRKTEDLLINSLSKGVVDFNKVVDAEAELVD